MPENPLLLGLLIAVLFLSAFIDFRTQKIPNLLTYPTILLAIGYHSFAYGVTGFYFSVSGLFVGILLLILPYLLGGMGAGDAKLMGAVGAFIGPGEVFNAFIYVALLGGIYAFGLILIRWHRFRGVLQSRWAWIKSVATTRLSEQTAAEADDKPVPKLCYGIVIALGTIVHIILEIHGVKMVSL